MTEAHTLFVRSNCKYSQIFLNTIEQNDMKNEFRIVDIDKNIIDHSRIKSVPTLIADHQQFLSGREAFAWLMNKVSSVIQPIVYSDNKGGFESMSSNYAYLDNAESSPISNSSLSVVYSSTGTALSGTGNNAPVQNESRKENSSLEDAMSRMKADREASIPQPVSRT